MIEPRHSNLTIEADGTSEIISVGFGLEHSRAIITPRLLLPS